ncbi:uncharacterized protein BYT42DRAFT_122697 [Radiomyces spectabilis]|uniref:uncharacterized protein n=1 Tax=Radiomyces spectabilis TaxID=64574 RepID=UPI002220D0D7|nr:uncharacterized protein BYT42DRAFT_122697 [Radiomyces spectabilis]KAI8368215.1 hypothetical protein BYT42DRAFT_122697 [Radiomyces spectabilis]
MMQTSVTPQSIYGTQYLVPETKISSPTSPIANINFFQPTEDTERPEIRTMSPPTLVKSRVQYVETIPMQKAYIEVPVKPVCASAAVISSSHSNDHHTMERLSPSVSRTAPRMAASISTSTVSVSNHDAPFMLQPVPSKSAHVNSNLSNSKPSFRHPQPLPPLVIPPTPIRSSSSPNRAALLTPRSSSIQDLTTPASSRSGASPLSSASTFSVSPRTPQSNTLLSPSPQPPGGSCGAAKKTSAKKQSFIGGSEAEELVHRGIKFHEAGQLEKATELFRQAANQNFPMALFLYGVSLRHGWGCKKSEHLAFQYLQKAAEHAVMDLEGLSNTVNTSAAKGELIMAIYELGVSFRHGWGCKKNKETAVYFFKIAADLGDPDAQNDLGHCYYHGHGVKKDLYMAAKYYRMAAKQGQSIMGNSWIYKSKYDRPK